MEEACLGLLNRYYFNINTGRCERFTYGGCFGNENNFRTRNDCKAFCIEQTIPRSALIDIRNNNFYTDDEDETI